MALIIDPHRAVHAIYTIFADVTAAVYMLRPLMLIAVDRCWRLAGSNLK